MDPLPKPQKHQGVDFLGWKNHEKPMGTQPCQGGDVENYMRNQRKKTGKDDFKPPAQALLLERQADFRSEISTTLRFFFSGLETVPPQLVVFADLFLVLAVAQRRQTCSYM